MPRPSNPAPAQERASWTASGRRSHTTPDPLRVRAGRGLVPSLELREPIGPLVQAALMPAAILDLGRLSREFMPRTREALSRTSARRRWPVSVRRRPACGCVSRPSQTGTARRFATAASNSHHSAIDESLASAACGTT